MPPVHCKQSAASHRHHCRDGQVGECVGSHVGYRRVGWKLEHHYHVLLHLIFKHEWALWKETLLSRKGREQKETKGIRVSVRSGRRRLKQMRLARPVQGRPGNLNCPTGPFLSHTGSSPSLMALRGEGRDSVKLRHGTLASEQPRCEYG